MFACIHASADPALLLECAQAFSPVVEQTAPDLAVLDASGLERIYGPAHEIAAAIGARASWDLRRIWRWHRLPMPPSAPPADSPARAWCRTAMKPSSLNRCRSGC